MGPRPSHYGRKTLSGHEAEDGLILNILKDKKERPSMKVSWKGALCDAVMLFFKGTVDADTAHERHDRFGVFLNRFPNAFKGRGQH